MKYITLYLAIFALSSCAVTGDSKDGICTVLSKNGVTYGVCFDPITCTYKVKAIKEDGSVSYLKYDPKTKTWVGSIDGHTVSLTTSDEGDSAVIK